MTSPPCNLCRLYDHWLYRRADDARRAEDAAGHNAALTKASRRAEESLTRLKTAKQHHVDHAHPDEDGDTE